ncbi:DNA ligase [Ralstonia pickettii]|uniref:DNA ligase n=1 Tax=Ralstonia pickettii TaxID=329 RepID=A0A2N4TY18_RALPI|nr:DNA ligase [Ralstonia pickettii]PLC44599.1 DNA ligase [Ralstonia pickettii]
MNSREIFLLVAAIGACTGKNDKLSLVKGNIDDPEFVRVLKAALDPTVTYGVAKRPEVSTSGGDVFDSQTWDILERLRVRGLTGNAARDTIVAEMERLDAESAELFWRIVAKDLRAGFSAETVNKAKSGTIPDFPYMRCSLPKDAKFDKWDWSKGAISQEKADAMFANVNHELDGQVAISSRQGSQFPIEAFAELADTVRRMLKPGTQTHGEIVVFRDGQPLARALSNGVMNRVLDGGAFEGTERPVFFAWDQIPLEAVVPKGKYAVPYKTRFTDLLRQLVQNDVDASSAVRGIPTRVVHSLNEAYVHSGQLMAQGKEGTVLKSPDATWKDGTSKEQIKLKLEAEVDLKVVAIVLGREGTKNEGRAGSLACESGCGRLQVDVTVKNEDMRDQVDANPDDWIGRIIEVRANDLVLPSASSDYYSLFLPRMTEACYRKDKSEADDLTRIEAIFAAAKLGQTLKEAA